MVETVSIKAGSGVAQPTLEESAKAMGINPENLDDTALSQTAKERPAWLPEKFKSEEDMAAAYAELERKLGTGGKSEAEETPDDEKPPQEDEKPEDKPATDEEDKARKEAEKAGVDFDELSAKYWEKGALEDADYEKLEKSGIPRGLVDEFAEGQKAIVELERMQVFSKVGGEELYNDMISWAGDNFTDKEIEAYDKAVKGKDKSAMFLAVEGLKARYTAQRGTEPSRIVEGRKSNSGADRYESVAQMQDDMRKPEYKKDPAFRAKVQAKLSRSDIM